MAIYLKVEDYCQDCNEFQVDVLQYQKGNGSRIDIHILCKNREKCRNIYEYLHAIKGAEMSKERF